MLSGVSNEHMRRKLRDPGCGDGSKIVKINTQKDRSSTHDLSSPKRHFLITMAKESVDSNLIVTGARVRRPTQRALGEDTVSEQASANARHGKTSSPESVSTLDSFLLSCQSTAKSKKGKGPEVTSIDVDESSDSVVYESETSESAVRWLS
jgi:hypothetical protein